MKKYLSILTLILLFAGGSHASAQTVTTTYSFTNIASSSLAATITTATTETPAGESLATLNVFKLPSGNFNVNATYR